MPLTPAISDLARQTMRVAFEELERTVTPADSRAFRSTTLEQTRVEALDIEKQLAARQALCNQRRLEPLLSGLEHYSRVVDILCNGTPFLSWIWAPISLILRVASEYVESFQQIMKGYSKDPGPTAGEMLSVFRISHVDHGPNNISPIILSYEMPKERSPQGQHIRERTDGLMITQIADALSRFKILSDTFITEASFQQTLAVFYADILQFHIHAYRFVRRSGWKLLFLTSWGRFQRRFDNILEDLDRHGQLVDQQANALNIAAVARIRQENSEWREKSLDRISHDEKLQAEKEYRSILSWLKVDETEQIQIIEAISDEAKKFPETCSWLPKNTKIKSWLQKGPEKPFLWLQGNAGCGKSVIAAKLVDSLRKEEHPIVCHFCTYTFPSSTRYDGILKSIVRQLLLRSDELIAHVYQECIVGKKQAGTGYLERLIQTLINTLSDEPREPLCMWIIVDGINECEAAKQLSLINLMNQISSISASTHGAICKVLLTTRPSGVVKRYLRKNQIIYLSDEKSPLRSAIRTYVAGRLESLHDRLRQLELESHEIEEIEELVSKKAGDMFLYARLVLDYVNANIFYSGDELKAAINQLPDTVNEFYNKLLSQILARLNEQSQERVRCIFGWIAFAKRPLKKLEFLSALSFTSGDHNLKRLVPRYIVEDICSPLIEERRDGSLTFIHGTVKHFLQGASSALILREEQTLHEQGIAAISCLLSGLQVLNNSFDEQTKLLRFVKGIHGFHVYATEYWTEYLLANAATSGGLKGQLLEAATCLAELLDKLDNTSILEPSKSKATINSKDDRLDLLNGYGSLRKHVERALYARSLRRFESELQTSIEPADGMSKAFNHRDGISTALDLYQKTVETLLEQDSCPGASAEELEQFKSQFRTSAYTCRLRSCPRATIGFKTHQLRHEHEVSHAGGFRCSFAGCQYPPYRTQKSLSAHISSVHSLAVPNPRRTIRRVGNLELQKDSTTTRRTKRPKSASTRQRDGTRPQYDAATIKPEDLMDISYPMHLVTEAVSEEPCTNGAVLTSDLTSGIGIGYFDIVMDKITGGMSMDPALYERAKSSFVHNMDAIWNLGEVAENLRDGLADAPTSDTIISRIWSKHHPELARELKQFVMTGTAQNGAGDLDTGTTGSNDVPRQCPCGEKDTEYMMACYNATCPNGWFHPSCVKRVITPFQNEKWFCSRACETADEERETEDEEMSDLDYY